MRKSAFVGVYQLLNMCVCVCMWSCIAVLKEDFSNIFVRSNSPETVLQGFKSFRVQI